VGNLDELISAFLGLATPMIISWFKGNHWSDRQAMIVSLVICICVGALSSIATHAFVLKEQMTYEDWASNALVVFTAATAFYKIHFENTRLNQTLEARGPFVTGTPQREPTP
jgi:hypothetical protein